MRARHRASGMVVCAIRMVGAFTFGGTPQEAGAVIVCWPSPYVPNGKFTPRPRREVVRAFAFDAGFTPLPDETPIAELGWVIGTRAEARG